MHFWSAAVAELEDPDRYAQAFALLSPGEQHHAARFRFDPDRNSFLVSRALRRRVLSQYAEVDPGKWQFSANEYGRPKIAFPQLAEPLEFNCSRSSDLVVCAVTRGLSVGVDVERLDRKVSPAIARSTFAASEAAALDAVPRRQRAERFFTYWTLKEAYLKARSRGLSLPLNSMAFAVTERPRLSAQMVFSAANDCSEWQFTLLSPTPRHIAAVCVRRLNSRDPQGEIRLFMA